MGVGMLYTNLRDAKGQPVALRCAGGKIAEIGPSLSGNPFGSFAVSGRMRVASPPANTTPCIGSAKVAKAGAVG